MTEQDDVVLSAEERAALAVERERPSFDDDAAARMLRRAALAIAVAPRTPDGGGQPSPAAPAGGAGGAGLGGAATGGLAKLAAVFAAGLAVGGTGVGVALQRPEAPGTVEARTAPSTERAAATSALSPPPPGSAAPSSDAAPVWNVSDLPSRPEPSRNAAPPRADSSGPDPAALVAESQLIDGVRTALGRGDAAAALALLDQHDARFSRGALAEEAGALRVRALRSAGRADDADRAAKVFLARYPRSLFRPMVMP